MNKQKPPPSIPSPVRHKVFIGILIIATLMLAPLYIFSSGGLQPVDLPIAIIGIYILFTTKNFERQMVSLLFLFFFIFIAWVVCINFYYYMIFYRSGFFRPPMQLFYSLTLFLTFIIIFHRLLRSQKTIPYIYIAFLLSSLMPGVTKSKELFAFGMRQTLSFNDPNQLADFGLLVICSVLILNNFLRTAKLKSSVRMIMKVSTIVIFFMGHTYILLSASRAGFGGILFLDLFLFWKYSRRLFLVAIMLLPLLMFFMKDSPMMKKGENSGDKESAKAMERMQSDGIFEALIKRTAGRIDLNDFTFIFGIGKCAGAPGLRVGEDSFEPEREAHNTLIDIVYSYGVIGLILFSTFLAFYLKNALVVKYHIPIFIAFIPANISQNFIRFRMLWIFYALTFSISVLYKKHLMQKEIKAESIPEIRK